MRFPYSFLLSSLVISTSDAVALLRNVNVGAPWTGQGTISATPLDTPFSGVLYGPLWRTGPTNSSIRNITCQMYSAQPAIAQPSITVYLFYFGDTPGSGEKNDLGVLASAAIQLPASPEPGTFEGVEIQVEPSKTDVVLSPLTYYGIGLAANLGVDELDYPAVRLLSFPSAATEPFTYSSDSAPEAGWTAWGSISVTSNLQPSYYSCDIDGIVIDAPSPTPTAAATATATQSAEATVNATTTASAGASQSESSTATATSTATETATASATQTETMSVTVTATATSTETATASATQTETMTVTVTATATSTGSSTITATGTSSFSAFATGTNATGNGTSIRPEADGNTRMDGPPPAWTAGLAAGALGVILMGTIVAWKLRDARLAKLTGRSYFGSVPVREVPTQIVGVAQQTQLRGVV